MSWHPEGKLIEVEDRAAHVVDVGEGPVVLLIHGFLHSSWTWRSTIERLARRYRVIAPCLRGFGWSDRGAGDYTLRGLGGWVRGVLDELGVGPVHATVGNSLGGGVALRLSLDDPARFGRLVLVDSLGATSRAPRVPVRLLGHPRFEPLFRLTAGNPRFTQRALKLLVYKRIPVDDQVMRGFEHLSRPGTHAAVVETARLIQRDNRAFADELAAVAVPTAVLWGSRDTILPVSLGHKLAEQIPGSRLVIFQGSGHCPQEDDPIEFEAQLEAFLRS